MNSMRLNAKFMSPVLSSEFKETRSLKGKGIWMHTKTDGHFC